MSVRPRWSREEIEAARHRIHSALGSTAPEEPPDFNLRGFTSGNVPFGPAFHAAAVLSRFRMDDLSAIASGAGELQGLQERSIALREQGWRTLVPDVRNAILRDIPPGEVLSLLDRHRREDDPLQSVLRKVHQGLTPAMLRAMSIGELAALLQIWEGIFFEPPLFPRNLVERRLQLARLLEPLRRITSTFSGRTAEMQQLRDYVGVLSTGSRLGDGLRAIGDFLFKPVPKGPFLIHGPGGIGKTTLTAKFILEHALAAEQQQFPFAYLDFDRPAVNADEPVTILIEAIRQIGLQYDSAFAASERLRGRWKDRRSADMQSFVLDFAGFLEQLEAREGPVLFVLDTFEEVQRRSTAYAAAVIRLTSLLSTNIPRLRVVIAGRSPLEDLILHDELALATFDEKSAIAYLQNGGLDPATAELVAERTRGNPLTLTLAIELYRRDPAELRQLDVARLTDEIIQSSLFDRILLHIPDPEVRRLAHPGLVLRRVTPEIIRDVLAKPCGIEVPDLERAADLFEKLASDSTLVTRVDPRTLVHRSDVRRLMLKPLREHQPQKVDEIHRAAIRFYRRESDVISRAEVAYHSLSLGEPVELTPDLEPLLVNALDDLAPAAQVQLAEAYKLELPPETWTTAGQESWERMTARQVEEVLQVPDPERALVLLARRIHRSAHTDLLIVEARAHLANRDAGTARFAARRGITAYRDAGSTALLFRMLLVAAEIELRENAFAAADSFLAEAEDIARRRDDPLMLVQALAERVRVEWIAQTTADAELVAEIVEAASRVSDETWAGERVLLQEVVSHAAVTHPAIAARAARLGALDLTELDLNLLARVFRSSKEEVERQLATAPSRGLLVALENILGARFRLPEMRVPDPSHPLMKDIRLKSAQREQLRDLLVKHYGGDLAGFVETRYSRGLESFSLADDAPRNAMDLVRASEREGWLNDLIVGLWRSRFLSLDVLAFIDGIGLGPQVRVANGDNVVPEKRLRSLLSEYRASIAAIEARTCRVLWNTVQTGCGFLLRHNVVTTSRKAIPPEPALQFDRVVLKGRSIDDGLRMERFRIDPSDTDPTKIFVEDGFGNQPLERTRAAPQAPARGAITLPKQPRIDPNQPIFWLWREEEGTFISGVTKLGALPAGWFVTYAKCSSAMVGAPCFDATLNVIGMLVGAWTDDATVGTIQPIWEP